MNRSERARQNIREALSKSSHTTCDETRVHLNAKFVEAHELFGYLRTYPRADGMYLWDDQNRKYTDFLAGYGSIPLGHNPQEVWDAIDEVRKASPPHFILMAPEALPAAVAKRLAALAPGDLSMSFFSSSGSEAVDGAMKLARAATKRNGFVFADGAYHGMTFGALSVIGDAHHRHLFGNLLADCVQTPWGDADAIERRLQRRDIAAVILEPIQGEGGIRTAPPAYFKRVKQACEATGTLFIMDEVQTGLGRCGEIFYSETLGIVPDIIVLAKGLSGGIVPVSAYITRPDLWDRAYGRIADHELHCTTYRGGPLAMAAALTTLDQIVERKLSAHARDLGKRLENRLAEVTRGHALIKEVRGAGLLWGIEVNASRGTNAAIIAQSIVVGLLERGIVTQVGSLAEHVVRVEPPLIAEREHIDAFTDALDDVLRTEVTGKVSAFAQAGKRLFKSRAQKILEQIR